MTGLINARCGIIPTISKHIVSDEPLSRGYKRVRIDESSDRRIIIPALEIIESSLFGRLEAAKATQGPQPAGVGGWLEGNCMPGV